MVHSGEGNVYEFQFLTVSDHIAGQRHVGNDDCVRVFCILDQDFFRGFPLKGYDLMTLF